MVSPAKLILSFLIALTPLAVAAADPDGTPDGTFAGNVGSSGFLAPSVGSVAIQSDDKILVGGSFETLNGAPPKYLARLNADGTPDGAFNATITSLVSFNGWIGSVVVQPNGKIVVGGNFTNYSATPDKCVARLNADGTPDGAFNANAGSVLDGTFLTETVYSLALQSNGKIVMGGAFYRTENDKFNRLARLNADGTADTAFNANLSVGFNSIVRAVAVQSDGRILAGGQFTSLNGTTVNRLARLNADGTPDTSFNANVSTGLGFDGTVLVISIQPDGKILVGGGFTNANGTSANRIARLNADGTLDTAFATNIGSGFPLGQVNAIALGPDSRIMVGGLFLEVNGTTSYFIARLNADGTPDTAYSDTVGPTLLGPVNTIGFQSDGKTVVGGSFTRVVGKTNNGIARLLGTAPLPVPTPTPTLGEWAQATLALLLVAMAGWRLRSTRRR